MSVLNNCSLEELGNAIAPKINLYNVIGEAGIAQSQLLKHKITNKARKATQKSPR